MASLERPAGGYRGAGAGRGQGRREGEGWKDAGGGDRGGKYMVEGNMFNAWEKIFGKFLKLEIFLGMLVSNQP